MCSFEVYSSVLGAAGRGQAALLVVSGNAVHFCEAQGKGRARGGPIKVTQRSFIDGGWWMVDILSLMLTLNLVATRHPPPPPDV